MTSGNVSDEPIAYRDDDALARLGGDRRPVPASTTGRSRRAPTTRCVRVSRRRTAPADPAALARLRPGRPRAARRRAAAAARLRRRAQEHVLPGQGRARLGEPPHRRPRELRDAALVHRGDRALRAPVRGRRPRSSPTTCTPSTSRPSTRSSATASSSSASSTTTRTWPRAWPSTASRRPAVGAIFDGTGYGTDGTVWGGELLVGDLRGVRARRARCWPVRAARRRARRSGEPWRMACAWLAAALGDDPASRRRWRRASTPRAWEQVAAAGADRARRRR